MPLYWGRFWLFWGSDRGLWGHRGEAWPPWMCMRWDKVADLVQDKIKGLCNIILTTFQRCLEKLVNLRDVFDYFRALMEASRVTDMRRGLPGCE